jgi:peptidyl-prolyl cis-trans isomerase D
LIAQLKANTSLTDTKKNEQKFKSSGFFTRYDEIPNIGYEKDISQAAFMLSKENPCPKNAVKGSKGYYAIIFKERKAPEMEGFEKEKANIKENLLQRKQVKLLDTMVKGLRKNSDVSIKEGFI